MIKKALFAALLAVGLVAGPAFAGDQHYRVVATDPKNISRIEVPLGDRLVLRLEDCTDCGYSWKFVSKPNPAVIEFTKKLNNQRDNPRCTAPCVGGSVHVRYEFQSKAQGATTVKLAYYPPGQNQKPKKTLLLNLVVTS